MKPIRLLIPFLVAVLATPLVACGPSHVQLDPRQVANVSVRPASGQKFFCPGDAFQVEVIAKLNDGSTCSSVEPALGCMGEKDAVIDPDDIRLNGDSGKMEDKSEWIWMPPSNPLATAASGITFTAWLETTIDDELLKSSQGTAELTPVYDCQQKDAFGFAPPDDPDFLGKLLGQTGEPPADGADGQSGPNLEIAVTALSTPFYPNAALIRVRGDQSTRYYISPSVDKPVTIVTRGEDGHPGRAGEAGRAGSDGRDATSTCGRGGDGGDGTAGTAGSDGGNGGNGGSIVMMLDEASADTLRHRVLASSRGGKAGRGGHGGVGGRRGYGGDAGPSGKDCKGEKGKSGEPGRDGPSGARGQAGTSGGLRVETVPREALFGKELGIIRKIEAAKAKR